MKYEDVEYKDWLRVPHPSSQEDQWFEVIDLQRRVDETTNHPTTYLMLRNSALLTITVSQATTADVPYQHTRPLADGEIGPNLPSTIGRRTPRPHGD